MYNVLATVALSKMYLEVLPLHDILDVEFFVFQRRDPIVIFAQHALYGICMGFIIITGEYVNAKNKRTSACLRVLCAVVSSLAKGYIEECLEI